MMSAGFLHLQALLVVAMAGSSFGRGGEECFDDGNGWARWFGMEADSERFVVKGSDGMCLAVYGGRGVDFALAVNACNVSFVGGRLLTKGRWGAFLKARDNSDTLKELNKTIYVGFSPQPESGCFVIDQYLKVTLEDPCQMQRRSFVCEYPWQEFCKWEVMQEETPVRRPDGQWELKQEVVQLQEADGSKVSCKPYFLGRLISAKLAACRPLFKDAWSEWSECRICKGLEDYHWRYQDINDRCEPMASDGDGNVYRFNKRSCFHMPCSNATTSTDATTEGGVSVISISHLPMLFVFLSMFSYL